MSLPLFLAGCLNTSVVHFTIASTEDLSAADLERLEPREATAIGEAKQMTVLIFPIGASTVPTAIERAIASEPGCVAIADGTIERFDRTFFPLIYSDSRVVVEGTPLIDTNR